MTTLSKDNAAKVFLPASAQNGLPRSLSAIRQRLGLLKWLAPTGLLLVVVIYEIGPARWIHDVIGETHHFLAEIVIYGSVGPLLTFTLLHFLGRWLEERETSDLQAQVLARARQQAEVGHQLSDEVLQSLFAVSAMLASLEAGAAELLPAEQLQLRNARTTLDQTVQQLQAYLLHKPVSKE
ncbi:MAG: hypothetical protein HYZ49_14465 [Chloroflexi bacterium]|nr:hypothetical protein [Chloroflexota bacterium]